MTVAAASGASGSTGSKVPPRPKIDAALIDSRPGVCEADILGRSTELKEITSQCLTGRVTQANADWGWRPACKGKAFFSSDHWLKVMKQLIRHPEHSSSDIRRADILEASGLLADDGGKGQDKEASSTSSHVRRQLKPRRPNLDTVLRQDCYLVYSSTSDATFVIYVPLDEALEPVSAPDQVPFYHPAVRAIAFAYVPDNGMGQFRLDASTATLEVHVAPFQKDFNATEQPQHRLSRTALRLVELQTRLAWGQRHGYKKRVEHDCIVKREDYMDLYQELRTKYSPRIIPKWAEATDPRKHVFEDIGIAAFLMILWRDMHSDAASKGSQAHEGCMLEASKTWGRPECFVDVGCGNGLLVHLLNAEGYHGFGVDVRERKTWTLLRRLEGGADLRASSIRAPLLASREADAHRPWPKGSFLIGNHADELTAWLPLVAAADASCLGLVNIPCCRYQLDGSIANQMKHRAGHDEEAEMRRLVAAHDVERTLQELHRGPPTESADSTSRNIAYLRYVSHLHLLAGWALEKEALRIPSTKNWCIVSRRRAFSGCPLQVEEKARSEALLRVHEMAAQKGANWQARAAAEARSSKAH